jgi:hypothetical protein
MPLAMDRVKERSKELTDQMIADIQELTKTTTPSAEKPTEK